MFDRTYYATHPDMMECVSNEELRDRYLIQDLFREGECVLNYTHADRFVIGGVAVGGGAGEAARPDRAAVGRRPSLPRAARAGDRQCRQGRRHRHRRRRELHARQQGLPLRHDGREGRRVLRRRRALLSRLLPGAQGASRRASCRSPTPMRWSAAASRNRTSGRSTSSSSRASAISAQLVMGLTVLKPGSVWNTMPPHIHERRSEIYFYFELDGAERPRLPLSWARARRCGTSSWRTRKR